MRLCGEEGRAGEVGGDVVSGWTGPGCTATHVGCVEMCGKVWKVEAHIFLSAGSHLDAAPPSPDPPKPYIWIYPTLASGSSSSLLAAESTSSALPPPPASTSTTSGAWPSAAEMGALSSALVRLQV